MIHRAMASGVQGAIVLTESIADINRALELREKYASCYVFVLHTAFMTVRIASANIVS